MKKKKLLAVALVIVVAAMISGVAAWLSDDETRTDEITVGRVSIVLNEPNWRPENASDVHPQDILPQNPTVSNSGNTNAYVFVEVRMSALKPGAQIDDPKALLELQAPTPLYLTRSRQGEFDTANWQRLVGPVYDSKENTITCVYAYAKGATMTPLLPGASTTAVFDSVQLQSLVRRDDVLDLDANIYVRAYAIQAGELGDNGTATAPGAVWNIVRNTYDVQLATQTLPQTTPKVLQAKPSPTATPKPTFTPKPTATPRPANAEWLDAVSGDDDVFRSIFGTPDSDGKSSVG